MSRMRHQSLRVRLDGRAVVPAADDCYFCRTDRGDAGIAPRLTALEEGGVRIFYGHDPGFWQTEPQAPRADQPT